MMDEKTFLVLWFALIGLGTGVVTGIIIASTVWALPILVLSYIMLAILYGLLLFAAYMQWREERG